ncbi:MAG: 3-isopropylmalate dehydratase small subunit [Dehalococcoidia bacterium]
MIPFVKVTSVAAPLDRVNVDTDQIIPKQFLKRIERTGFGEFAFFDWRYTEDGTLNPAFELNHPAYAGAQILIAGRNFGSGSSREHAPWALNEYGFRAIIAPSFADIFRNNCIQNGMLPVTLPEETVQKLIRRAQETPGYRLTVDLEEQAVYDDEGFVRESFEIDPFVRTRLLGGLDDIGMTMQEDASIEAFEEQRPRWLEVAEKV